MNPLRSALFTDLYELAMAQAYFAERMDQVAVFELAFRNLPESRNYIVAAGLEDVLAYLENFCVTEEDSEYLRQQGQFSEPFLQHLRDLRFTGHVYAIAEGTPVFPNEPLVQVVAPIVEAQLIETLMLNQVHFQSLAAAKGARVMTAAQGRPVVDFGSRRAHGTDAALKVARTSYLVGAVGTSNVLAGKIYDIPIFGTMAHSYIQAHDAESVAFEKFAGLYPHTTFLVDTYDTLSGVRKVIELQSHLGEKFRIGAIRLDSGDLGELARQSGRLLDEAGLNGVTIFASGGLDEDKIAALIAAGAPIDAFGVGTNLAVADGAAQLDMAYKLVEYAGRPRMKLSSRKVTYPGRKQVFRTFRDGRMVHDLIAQYGESLPGEPLLQPVMRNGKRLPAGRITLRETRQFALQALRQLPHPLRSLLPATEKYAVHISEATLHQLDAIRKSLEESERRLGARS